MCLCFFSSHYVTFTRETQLSRIPAAGIYDSQLPVWLRTVSEAYVALNFWNSIQESQEFTSKYLLDNLHFSFHVLGVLLTASPPHLSPLCCRRVRLAFAVNYHSAHIIAGEFEMTADVWHGVKTEPLHTYRCTQLSLQLSCW